MDLFLQAAALVSEAPGSLAYHLILLFALGVAAALGLSRWRRARDAAGARLALASGGLVALRLVALVVAFLAALTLINPLLVVPPFDRAESALGILLIIWLAAFPIPHRLADAGFALLAVIVVVALIISWGLWAQEALALGFYNGFLQETVWENAKMALLAVGLALVLLRRQPNWLLSAAVLVVLLAGHIVHVLQTLAGTNVPGPERLAEIVAMPLLVALIYRRSQVWTEAAAAPTGQPAPAGDAEAEPLPAGAVDPATAPALPQMDLKAALALASLNAAKDAHELGDLAAVAVAHAVRAPACLLIDTAAADGALRATRAYHTAAERFVPAEAVLSTNAEDILAALQNGASLAIAPSPSAAEWPALARTLELPAGASLHLLPLRSGDGGLHAVLGVVPPAGGWPSASDRLLAALGPPLAATWSAVERRAALAQELQAAQASMKTAEDEAARLREQAEALNNQLQLHRRAESVHAEQLAKLEALRATTQQLQAEAEQHQQQAAQAQAEAEAARQAEQQAREEMAALRAELAQVTEQATQAAAAAPAFGGSDLATMLEALATAEARLAAEKKEVAQLREALAESERQRAESEQARAATAAGQPAPAADMEVIASLTQELRQPMSSIVGYADLLLSESVGIIGALQRKFLERIKASSERIGVLLDDLIRVMDIDSGNLRLAHESVDVTRVIDDALHACESLYQSKNVRLAAEIPASLPPMQADRDALLQIFTHLLNNAGAASANDSEVKLIVQCEADQRPGGETLNYLVFSVTDTGGGIAPDDQPRVFSRLYRADAPLIAGLGDNGMGLSIAKALVEGHGGRIWVISEAKQGSTFYVLLPVEGKASKVNGSHPAK